MKRYNIFIEDHNKTNRDYVDETGMRMTKKMKICEDIITKFQMSRYQQIQWKNDEKKIFSITCSIGYKAL